MLPAKTIEQEARALVIAPEKEAKYHQNNRLPTTTIIMLYRRQLVETAALLLLLLKVLSTSILGMMKAVSPAMEVLCFLQKTIVLL